MVCLAGTSSFSFQLVVSLHRLQSHPFAARGGRLGLLPILILTVMRGSFLCRPFAVYGDVLVSRTARLLAPSHSSPPSHALYRFAERFIFLCSCEKQKPRRAYVRAPPIILNSTRRRNGIIRKYEMFLCSLRWRCCRAGFVCKRRSEPFNFLPLASARTSARKSKTIIVIISSRRLL